MLPNGVLHNHICIPFILHIERLYKGESKKYLLMNQIFTFISSFPVINVLYICTVINHPPELDKSMDKKILQ